MGETDQMVEALRRLVEAESPSSDPQALGQCAGVIGGLCRALLGSEPERLGPHLRWNRPGDRPVLILCHYDTVWPLGTLEAFPFTLSGSIARGPGTFDMKAGIVQGLFAIREVPAGPVTILFTADEETGSDTSRELIEEEARRSRAVLVLEPAADGGAVKVARKGSATWRVEVRGRASHAGLEPAKGANAAVELARQVIDLGALARAELGTSVTVTMLGAGSAENVVPELAWCVVDARVWTMEEATRLGRDLDLLGTTTAGTSLSVSGGLNRGPLERRVAEDLYRRLLRLGFQRRAAEVGGSSDGNLTSALGIPTLDGLGAIGGGAHARDEHVSVEAMPSQAAMVSRLVDDLLTDRGR